MPRVSRWMMKVALTYFGVGLSVGAYLLLHKAVNLDPGAWRLLSYHIEIMIFGWILQFVMGVAYWMMPRFVKGPPRGPVWHAWLMVILLNTGILLNLLNFGVWSSNVITLAGRLLEVGSVGLFVHIHWSRIYGLRELQKYR